VIKLKTFAAAHRIEADDDALDYYSRRGVVISRDAAHIVLRALGNDIYGLEQRGGEANLIAAEEARELRDAINSALAHS
jgi:hypothetical protein